MVKKRSNLDQFLIDMGQKIGPSKSPMPTSTSFMRQGDILSFRYAGDVGYRIVLLVKIKRGNGTFISTKGNTLLACFNVDHVPPEILGYILKALYKNRKFADYYYMVKTLSPIFGIKEFRSYNFRFMTYLNSLELNSKNFPLLEDGQEQS
jgi:hypothetical protein